jgi:catechol 2,3-dioxygenase-like lactoylglutathione lyase family enzyme
MNIEHIAFNVADPVALAAWYCRHLEMTVARRVEGPTNTHFLADESGRVVLEFYHRTDAPVPDYRAIAPMTLHIAFTVADIDGTRQRLESAGATRDGDTTVAANGDQLAFLRDPWGLTLQLVKRSKPLIG